MIVTSRAPVRVDFGGAWTDVDIFARDSGGVVLNATIDKYVTGRFEAHESGVGVAAREGLDVHYGLDLPSGCGLGTSAALNVVWLSLIKSRVAGDEDRMRIAELAYQLEAMLGILGGKQDQYAAALGGFCLMRFGAEGVAVERLDIAPEVVRALEARCVLCYTGRPRLSGAIHQNVWGAFRAGNPNTVSALHNMRALAERMRPALLEGDLDGFARLVGENWVHQKALDPSVTNREMEALFAAAERAGSLGGKACGAGGGGCLLFVTAAGKTEAVGRALEAAGARWIPFAFEFDGLRVSHEK